MVQLGECYAVGFVKLILMVFQAGVKSKWANDSQQFLLEHFYTIHKSPLNIYHSALPLSPLSWLHRCYSAEISDEIGVVIDPGQAHFHFFYCSVLTSFQLNYWNQTSTPIANGSDINTAIRRVVSMAHRRMFWRLLRYGLKTPKSPQSSG